MRTFTSQFNITSIKRQVYTGNKSALVEQLTGTIPCYLRPTSPEAAAIAGIQWGKAFDMITEPSSFSSIKEGDRIAVVRASDSVSEGAFSVRGVSNHDRGGATAYSKYTLERIDEKLS